MCLLLLVKLSSLTTIDSLLVLMFALVLETSNPNNSCNTTRYFYCGSKKIEILLQNSQNNMFSPLLNCFFALSFKSLLQLKYYE